jgi:hypothetical protein
VSLQDGEFFYIDNEEYKPMSIKSTTFGGETNERYELDTNEVDIIIDAGADAPIFPSSMLFRNVVSKWHCKMLKAGQFTTWTAIGGSSLGGQEWSGDRSERQCGLFR